MTSATSSIWKDGYAAVPDVKGFSLRTTTQTAAPAEVMLEKWTPGEYSVLLFVVVTN
jgi:hypothetical protein